MYQHHPTLQLASAPAWKFVNKNLYPEDALVSKNVIEDAYERKLLHFGFERTNMWFYKLDSKFGKGKSHFQMELFRVKVIAIIHFA